MRRSPLDDYDLQVSVEELAPPLAWGSLPSLHLQSSVTGRWTSFELSSYLRRRATLHMSVLALATAVLAGSAFVANQKPDAAIVVQAGPGAGSLALAAKSAIVARAIPLTSQGSDALYQVQPGDTLNSIAHQVGVNEEALLAFNGLTSSDALNVGLRLRIPDLAKVPAEQLRIKDTAPHEATPPVTQSLLTPQKPTPQLSIREIQKGDNPYDLAVTAGVTEATVLASNNLHKDSVLSIGQTLVIPAINGRLVATKPGDTVSALAALYSSTVDGIIAANKLDPRTQTLVPDQLVLIPADVDVAAAIIKDIPAQAAKPAAQAAPQQEEAAAPKIPAPPQPASSPGFQWPAPGSITTYFSSWHNGVDIANSTGTAVRAVQAGRVVFSGWDNSGYGYMVRIDHGNGLQTLYGHASRLLARAGDYVDKGDVIMLMGSTGRSTGPHVHFSVFQGSSYAGLNPLRYLP
jgi:murein DD-endopeptidase MepM/ murein hydrolase activator NlpD